MILRNFSRTLGAAGAAMQTRRRLLHRIKAPNHRNVLMLHQNRLSLHPLSHFRRKTAPTLFLEYVDPLELDMPLNVLEAVGTDE